MRTKTVEKQETYLGPTLRFQPGSPIHTARTSLRPSLLHLCRKESKNFPTGKEEVNTPTYQSAPQRCGNRPCWPRTLSVCFRSCLRFPSCFLQYPRLVSSAHRHAPKPWEIPPGLCLMMSIQFPGLLVRASTASFHITLIASYVAPSPSWPPGRVRVRVRVCVSMLCTCMRPARLAGHPTTTPTTTTTTTIPPLPQPAASNSAQRGRPLDPPRLNRQCTAQPTPSWARALCTHVRQKNHY